MDWKDALNGLISSGELPPGEENLVPEPEKPATRKERLEIVKEKKGRHGKTATIIVGFECDDEELQRIASVLKQRMGCGGSARDGEILIQGDCKDKVKQELTRLGYKVR